MQKLVLVFALSIFPSLFLFQACSPFTEKFSFSAQIFLIGEDSPSSTFCSSSDISFFCSSTFFGDELKKKEHVLCIVLLLVGSFPTHFLSHFHLALFSFS